MFRLNRFDKALWLFFALIALLIGARIAYTGSSRFIFLIWNLFLAWVPYVISSYFPQFFNKRLLWKKCIFAAWLLFVPNSFYIITDLIHLRLHPQSIIWYDAVFLFACSFEGVLLGFVSLSRAEGLLAKMYSPKIALRIMPFVIFLIGYGIYLGRFERWNSWDLVHKPFTLLGSIADSIISPIDNYRVWAITCVFASLIIAMYWILKILPMGQKEH